MVALWRHAKPIRNIAKAKAINIGLAQALGGKVEGFDSCQSIEHLYRVPNTTNIPDRRKRAKGRIVTVAGDAAVFPSRRYKPDDFPAPKTEVPTALTKAIGDAEDVDLDALQMSQRSREIFTKGQSEIGEPPPDDSPSGWRMALINSLKRDSIDDEAILGMLMHPDCAVATEKRSTDATRERLYRKEISKATAFREANGLESKVNAEDDFDDIPGDDEDEDTVNDGAFYRRTVRDHRNAARPLRRGFCWRLDDIALLPEMFRYPSQALFGQLRAVSRELGLTATCFGR